MTASERENRMADLSAYLDGELDAAGRAAVERLLTESAEARQALAELRAVSEQLRRPATTPAPPGLAASVMRQLPMPRAAAAGSGRSRGSRNLRLATRLLAVAATLALTAVGVRWFVLISTVDEPYRLRSLAPAEAPAPTDNGGAANEDDQERVERRVYLDQPHKAPALPPPTDAAELGRAKDEFSGFAKRPQPTEADKQPGDALAETAAISGGLRLKDSREPPTVATGISFEAPPPPDRSDQALSASLQVNEPSPAVVLRVVVQARTQSEFDGALQAIRRYRESTAPAIEAAGAEQQHTDAVADKASENDGGRAQGEHEDRGRNERYKETLRVPVGAVLPLLANLEQESPGGATVRIGLDAECDGALNINAMADSTTEKLGIAGHETVGGAGGGGGSHIYAGGWDALTEAASRSKPESNDEGAPRDAQVREAAINEKQTTQPHDRQSPPEENKAAQARGSTTAPTAPPGRAGGRPGSDPAHEINRNATPTAGRATLEAARDATRHDSAAGSGQGLADNLSRPRESTDEVLRRLTQFGHDLLGACRRLFTPLPRAENGGLENELMLQIIVLPPGANLRDETAASQPSPP